MVSATISLPLSGSFSPFSRLTGSLSVVEEYLALRGGPRMFTPSFTSSTLLFVSSPPSHRYRTITYSGRTFQNVHDASTLIMTLGWSAFARRYSRNRFYFLFLWLLRCFSSPGSLRHPMHSGGDDPPNGRPGCPIRKSLDRGLIPAP